jgi:hypothetical protein
MEGSFREVFERGIAGHHVLFGDGTLGRAFETRDLEAVDQVTANQVAALADFLERETDLSERKRLISSAPAKARGVFVRFYVAHLFDFLRETGPELH